MNKNLQLGLIQMTEEEYHELSLAQGCAEKLRHMMKHFNLSVDQVASRFHLTPEAIGSMRNMHYEFTLRDIAKINAYYEELVIEDVKKELKEKELLKVVADQLGTSSKSLSEDMDTFSKTFAELEEKLKNIKLYNGPTSTA